MGRITQRGTSAGPQLADSRDRAQSVSPDILLLLPPWLGEWLPAGYQAWQLIEKRPMFFSDSENNFFIFQGHLSLLFQIATTTDTTSVISQPIWQVRKQAQKLVAGLNVQVRMRSKRTALLLYCLVCTKSPPLLIANLSHPKVALIAKWQK